MSDLTMNITMPVLEELAKRDEEFVVKLSFAAAKQISERYSEAILRSKIVETALANVEQHINAARKEAGILVADKIGKWDNLGRGGYSLHREVAEDINREFMTIARRRFEEWFKEHDFDKLIEKYAKEFVDNKMSEVLRMELGKFLTKRQNP